MAIRSSYGLYRLSLDAIIHHNGPRRTGRPLDALARNRFCDDNRAGLVKRKRRP
jgi:hypothetical protein